MGIKKIKFLGFSLFEIEDSEGTNQTNKSKNENENENEKNNKNSLFSDKEMIKIIIRVNNDAFDAVLHCFNSLNDGHHLVLKKKFEGTRFPKIFERQSLEFLYVITYMLHLQYTDDKRSYSYDKILKINNEIMLVVNKKYRLAFENNKLDYLNNIESSSRNIFICWEKIKLFNLYFLYHYLAGSYNEAIMDDIEIIKGIFDLEYPLSKKIIQTLENL